MLQSTRKSWGSARSLISLLCLLSFLELTSCVFELLGHQATNYWQIFSFIILNPCCLKSQLHTEKVHMRTLTSVFLDSICTRVHDFKDYFHVLIDQFEFAEHVIKRSAESCKSKSYERALFFSISIVIMAQSDGGMWQIEKPSAALMCRGVSKITETFKSNPNYFLLSFQSLSFCPYIISNYILMC